MSKPGDKTYFQAHSQSTMMNFYHLNYPSCKIPFLASHTFHPPFTCTVPPSLCSPATILSRSRSHRRLASDQSLEQGAQLGRQGLRYVWQCFSRPLHTEWLKKKGARGAFCCCVQEEISVKVLLEHNEMSCTDHSKKNEAGRQTRWKDR